MVEETRVPREHQQASASELNLNLLEWNSNLVNESCGGVYWGDGVLHTTQCIYFRPRLVEKKSPILGKRSDNFLTSESAQTGLHPGCREVL